MHELLMRHHASTGYADATVGIKGLASTCADGQGSHKQTELGHRRSELALMLFSNKSQTPFCQSNNQCFNFQRAQFSPSLLSVSWSISRHSRWWGVFQRRLARGWAKEICKRHPEAFPDIKDVQGHKPPARSSLKSASKFMEKCGKAGFFVKNTNNRRWKFDLELCILQGGLFG